MAAEGEGVSECCSTGSRKEGECRCTEKNTFATATISEAGTLSADSVADAGIMPTSSSALFASSTGNCSEGSAATGSQVGAL